VGNELNWPRRVGTVASEANPADSIDRASLKDFGLEVEFHRDVASALIAIGRQEPALVMLPSDALGLDPVDVVSAVTKESTAPIVVGITGRDAEGDLALRVLEAGARGLVGMPLRPDELDRAIRRWSVGAPAHRVIVHEDLRIDVGAHRVTVAGCDVELTPREFELLCVLASGAGHVFGRLELATRLGDPRLVTSSRLRVAVGRVRRKLERSTARPATTLETVRGVGYRIAVRSSEPSTEHSGEHVVLHHASAKGSS
jgi:DNA-binding response OmpR family regulator